jgi:hypothetical protein
LEVGYTNINGADRRSIAPQEVLNGHTRVGERLAQVTEALARRLLLLEAADFLIGLAVGVKYGLG